MSGISKLICMARTVTTRLPKVRTFFRCAIQLGTTLALIIKNPTAVGICTDFEAFRIVISQLAGACFPFAGRAGQLIRGGAGTTR